MQAHLACVQAFNPAINAIVTVTAEAALQQAAAADERQARGEELPLLHGLPVAHKDCFLTCGVRTTYGSPIHRDFVPAQDSAIVSRQREQGAIALGKTNMPEFGAGSQTFNPVFGVTRNPYALDRTAGGSSGGAAAALAARMVALADGSDMGGSLRNPASFCNVVGLRPSPGRVPYWPTPNAYNALTVAGPMGRTVADVALMLAAIAGPDRRDPLSIDEDPRRFAGPLQRDFKGVRIAYAPDWGGLPVAADVRSRIDAHLHHFEQFGCEVEQACPDFGDADEAFHVLRAQAYALAQEASLQTHRDLIKPTLIWNIEKGLQQSVQDVLAAERTRSALFGRLHDFMQRYDFIVGPVSQVAPFPVTEEFVSAIDGQAMHNYIDWMRSCYYLTLGGNPSISVPCGFTPDGLPVGLQIVGRYRDEWGVLQLAHAFEQCAPYWKTAPACRAENR